jgi:GNAT superfamily N-acetyltransferase
MLPLPPALRAPDPRIPIRPVHLSDAESLFAACWPSRTFSAVYSLVQRAVRSAADGRGLGIVVPGAGNAMLGYGQALMWPTCAEISDMVVAIIQTLVHKALALGADEAEIGAALNNPRAASLYRRLGFEDSHSVLVNLGAGKEHILFLRLNLRMARTVPAGRE